MEFWSMSRSAEPVFRGVGVGELCELRSWTNCSGALISSNLASMMTEEACREDGRGNPKAYVAG